MVLYTLTAGKVKNQMLTESSRDTKGRKERLPGQLGVIDSLTPKKV